jgi:pimeloyl-ACP methyl ester carboxylesterase
MAPPIMTLVDDLASRDGAQFRSRAAVLYKALEGNGQNLMSLSVACGVMSWARPQRRVPGPLDNVLDLTTGPTVCRSLSRDFPNKRARLRAPFRTPALFITGTFDALSPPRNATHAASQFVTSTQVLVENGFHETLPHPSVQELVVRFLGGEAIESTRLTIAPPRLR